MSSIQGISGTSSLWDNTQRSTSSSAANQLSETVAQMKTGGGSTNSSSDDEETVTLQRVQPDGSIIILTMKGEEVISETKIRSPQSINEPLMMEGSMANQPVGEQAVLIDRFNDTSTSITAGAFFTQGV